MNEDFDPEKHDQRMQKLFSEEFYEVEEDEEKPVFPDLDEELEIGKIKLCSKISTSINIVLLDLYVFL